MNELRLMIHPILPERGKRLFDDNAQAARCAQVRSKAAGEIKLGLRLLV
jgi:hypothetical protein